MSGASRAAPAGPDTRSRGWVELGAFTALVGFCAFHWANLLVDPPIARVVAVVLVVGVTAAALADWRRRATGGPTAAALAALIALAGAAAGLVAAGVPVRLLAPWGWDELRSGVSDGIAGLGGATYPYRAGAEWPRLALMGAMPLMLVLAAALAFWPSQRWRALRAAGLVVLIVYRRGPGSNPDGRQPTKRCGPKGR